MVVQVVQQLHNALHVSIFGKVQQQFAECDLIRGRTHHAHLTVVLEGLALIVRLQLSNVSISEFHVTRQFFSTRDTYQFYNEMRHGGGVEQRFVGLDHAHCCFGHVVLETHAVKFT